VAAITDVPSSLPARRVKVQAALLWLAALELILVFAPTMKWLYGRWTMSVWHNAHGLLIFPVVAWFCYQELRRFAGPPAHGSAWGFAFVLPALALHVADTSMHTELLSAVALVLLLPGLSLLVLGVPRTRAIGFPLAFAAFALPIPLSMTESIHFYLRHIVTAGVAFVLPFLGVSHYIEGTTIHLANGALQVADACSGFSTLYAALAVGCLLAYTTPGWIRPTVTIAAAVPLAIGANILRVVLLVVLVHWRGEAILETWVHPASGMLTFAISLPVLFWIAQPPRARKEVGAR
jgi:exosortase